MSSIGPVTSSHSMPPPSGASDKSGSTSSTLTADQKAAKEADAAETKAAAQLAADEKAKATAAIIKTDQQTVKTTTLAAKNADAQVQADENQSGTVNITV